MQHPYLREGMAEERIARLLADAGRPDRRRGTLGAIVVAARERLGGRRPCEQQELGTAQLSEAA